MYRAGRAYIYTRTCVCVCVYVSRVRIHRTSVSDALSRVRVKINIWRHWVMITPRCACRGSPSCIHTCVHTCTRSVLWAARARERHNLPDFAEFPRRSCNARRKQCVRPETFPISERRSRVTSRVYWTFLNRYAGERDGPPVVHRCISRRHDRVRYDSKVQSGFRRLSPMLLKFPAATAATAAAAAAEPSEDFSSRLFVTNENGNTHPY